MGLRRFFCALAISLTGFTSLLFAPTAWAAAQVPDEILINGKAEPLFANPFVPFLRQPGQLEKLIPFFNGICSASWQRHIGQWELRDKKLYLLKVLANPCSQAPEAVPLTTFFPDAKGPVQASWFTGHLVVPRGKLVQFVDMGYASRYERYGVIEVRAGEVVAEEEIKEADLKR